MYALVRKTKSVRGNNRAKSVQGIYPKYNDTKMLKVKEWKKYIVGEYQNEAIFKLDKIGIKETSLTRG